MTQFHKHIGDMDYIKVCWACAGQTAYKQTYTIGCGQGYIEMMGPCSYCNETGILTAEGRPVSKSVLQQITTKAAREKGGGS